MAYDSTRVPISQSQSEIRRLVYQHQGTGVSFMSHPPREGFEALVTMGGNPYHIRVMATANTEAKDREQEERRVWRVLYWHLKAMFEAADSGVIAIEDIILPYIVTQDNRTIAEHVRPHLADLPSMNAPKLLMAGGLK